jgi:hypothetical protein
MTDIMGKFKEFLPLFTTNIGNVDKLSKMLTNKIADSLLLFCLDEYFMVVKNGKNFFMF